MNLTFEDLGIPLTHQKITPGNTATGFSKYCYEYHQFRLDFDAGTDELTVGSWIVGATSGAMANIVSITESSGTWAGDNVVGYLILDSWNGTAFTDNEKIKQAADATCADVKGLIKPHLSNDIYIGRQAKAALVYVQTQTQLIDITGNTPDQTSLIGQPMVANASRILRNIDEIKNFKTIDYTAASAGVVQATFFF